MPISIRYSGNTYSVAQDESVLSCLTRHDVVIPSSCRSGICQTCLMRATRGKPPAVAQAGLKDTFKTQNYFLACVCVPTDDMDIELSQQAGQTFTTTLVERTKLSAEICRLRLRRPANFGYQAGQFINLHGSGSASGWIRTYSLASAPELDDFLELHVQHVAGGRMSTYLFEAATPGSEVIISAAIGQCFYVSGRSQQPLLLIGSGSGLAPLYGIARSALAQGHEGDIWLYHGSHTVEGLYLQETLYELANTRESFHYLPSVSGPATHKKYAAGRAIDIALQAHPNLSGWRTFICGHPDMVKAAKTRVFMAGVSLKDIYADAFEYVKST